MKISAVSLTFVFFAYVKSQECIDNSEYRVNGRKRRSCKWVGNIIRRAKMCSENGPKENCPLTCGLCCFDNDANACAQYVKNISSCLNSTVARLCPRTCGVCCGRLEEGEDRNLKGCIPLGSPGGEELTFPMIMNNGLNGIVDIELAHRYANISGDVFSMRNARLLNGNLPGPTIKVNAGDTLRILYRNEMEDQGLPVGEINTFRHMDYTNLHFHGGHVSGELPSDDIRMKIPPGSSYQYQTTFPTTHMPGTHWIHPHVHGTAALHVSNGAALALIVKDPPNYLPSVVQEAQEVLMLLQDFDLARTIKVVREMGDEKFGYGPGTYGINYKTRLVNGQYRPYVTVQPNRWMRWRVIYAGHHVQLMDLKIISESCDMVLLAKDGIYIQDFPRPITLAPFPAGGRADLMVRCTTLGTYPVTTFGDNALEPTLVIQVVGTALPPTELPAWSPPRPPYLRSLLDVTIDPACTCHTQFDECSSVGPDDPFLGCLNDIPYSETDSVHSIRLGSAVERTNNAGRHSYHQHVYPFQFVGYAPQSQPDVRQEVQDYFRVGDWHDVIQMEGLQGDVVLRYQPREHLGLLMLHCHRLTHEDRGMMSWEYVYDPESGVCDCDVRLGL